MDPLSHAVGCHGHTVAFVPYEATTGDGRTVVVSHQVNVRVDNAWVGHFGLRDGVLRVNGRITDATARAALDQACCEYWQGDKTSIAENPDTGERDPDE